MFHMWDMSLGMDWWWIFGGIWMFIFWGSLIACVDIAEVTGSNPVSPTIVSVLSSVLSSWTVSSLPTRLLWLLKRLGRQKLNQEPPNDWQDKKCPRFRICSNATDGQE